MIKEFRTQYKDLVSFNKYVDENRSQITAEVESDMKDMNNSGHDARSINDINRSLENKAGAMTPLVDGQVSNKLKRLDHRIQQMEQALKGLGDKTVFQRFEELQNRFVLLEEHQKKQ